MSQSKKYFVLSLAAFMHQQSSSYLILTSVSTVYKCILITGAIISLIFTARKFLGEFYVTSYGVVFVLLREGMLLLLYSPFVVF